MPVNVTIERTLERSNKNLQIDDASKKNNSKHIKYIVDNRPEALQLKRISAFIMAQKVLQRMETSPRSDDDAGVLLVVENVNPITAESPDIGGMQKNLVEKTHELLEAINARLKKNPGNYESVVQGYQTFGDSFKKKAGNDSSYINEEKKLYEEVIGIRKNSKKSETGKESNNDIEKFLDHLHVNLSLLNNTIYTTDQNYTKYRYIDHNGYKACFKNGVPGKNTTQPYLVNIVRNEQPSSSDLMGILQRGLGALGKKKACNIYFHAQEWMAEVYKNKLGAKDFEFKEKPKNTSKRHENGSGKDSESKKRRKLE